MMADNSKKSSSGTQRRGTNLRGDSKPSNVSTTLSHDDSDPVGSLFSSCNSANPNPMSRCKSRTPRPSNPTGNVNLTSSMDNFAYAQMLDRKKQEIILSQPHRPTAEAVKQCVAMNGSCIFQLESLTSIQNYRHAYNDHDVCLCGFNHFNLALHNVAHYLYPKPTDSKTLNPTASTFHEYETVFGNNFCLYEEKFKAITEDHPMGQYLCSLIVMAKGTRSDHLASNDREALELDYYEKRRDYIETELYRYFNRRAASLPQAVKSAVLVAGHVPAQLIDVQSAQHDSASRAAAYRIWQRIADNHPNEILTFVIKLWHEDERLANLVFDNYQQQEMSQGLAHTTLLTNAKKDDGSNFVQTVTDALIKIAPVLPDETKSIRRSHQRLYSMLELHDATEKLVVELIEEADTTLEQETLALVTMQLDGTDENDHTIQNLNTEDGSDSSASSQSGSDSSASSSSQSGSDADATGGGDGDSDDSDSDDNDSDDIDSDDGDSLESDIEGRDDSEEEENGMSSGESSEEEDDDIDENLEKFRNLEKNMKIEIQYFQDLKFYEIQLRQHVQEADDDPNEHWLCTWVDIEQWGDEEFEFHPLNNWRLIRNDEEDVLMEDTIRKVNEYIPGQINLKHEEINNQSKEDTKEWFENNTETRQTSDKSTDWVWIVGLYAAFRSADRIDGVTICLFEYILLFASVDPLYRKYIVFTADAQTYNFVRHILYRIKYLHPDLDLGFILLVPELWHASKSALLGMFGGKRRKAGVLHALMLRFTFLVTGDEKEIAEGRFSLKHSSMLMLSQKAGELREAYRRNKEVLLRTYTRDKVDGNTELEALITTLNYCLPSMLDFLTNLSKDPKKAAKALRDLLVVLRMNNGTTYCSILIKFIAELLWYKDNESAFYLYAIENFTTLIGLPIEHMHAELARMHNKYAKAKKTGHASIDNQITRFKKVKDLRKFQEDKYHRIKPKESAWDIKQPTHARFEANVLLFEKILWEYFEAAYLHKAVDKVAPLDSQDVIVLHEELNSLQIEYKILKKPKCIGFVLTASLLKPEEDQKTIESHALTLERSQFFAQETWSVHENRQGFHFRRGPYGNGFYQDAGQICMLVKTHRKGTTLKVPGIVDGEYTMIFSTKGISDITIQSIVVTVANSMILSFDFEIAVSTANKPNAGVIPYGSFVLDGNVNCDSTLTFYSVDYKKAMCNNDYSIKHLRYPLVACGPVLKTSKIYEKQAKKLHVGDILNKIDDWSCRKQSLAAIEKETKKKMDEENERKKNNIQYKKAKIIFEFQTVHSVIERGVVHSLLLGTYSTKMTLRGGGISKEHITRLANTAAKFDVEFGALCQHTHLTAVDDGISWYIDSLNNIKLHRTVPVKQKGESIMWRRTMELLLAEKCFETETGNEGSSGGDGGDGDGDGDA